MLHHATGESYSSYHSSALRWEHQQRIFVELQGSKQFFSIGEVGDEKTEESKDGDMTSATQEGHVFGVKGGSKGSGSGLGKSASKCESVKRQERPRRIRMHN